MHIIHQHQCLHRRVGPLPFDDAGFPVRRIKDGQIGRWTGSFPEGVHTAAVKILTGVANKVDSVAVNVTDRFPQTLRLVGLDSWAAHLFHEQTGEEEGLIADHFRIETEAGATTEESIARIFIADQGIGPGLHPIGVGGHERANELFQIPVAGDEIAGEVVEQFRVTGPFSLQSEVFGGADETGAKELLPDAIDGHP